MAIYVSTLCLKNDGDLSDILDAYSRNGIKNVELGPFQRPIPEEIEFKKYGFKYLVHHYFPPPLKPFIINLASQDEKILRLSKNQIKKSIDLCSKLGVELFSFHAGFRADPDLNYVFPKDNYITLYEKAFGTFVESVKEINNYAVNNGVRLAIENNVLSNNNLIKGKNELLLLCEAFEYEELWDKVRSNNLGVLLDLGHLKITSISLGFDRQGFIERVKDKIFALHIHDNDGKMDGHFRITDLSWCLDALRKYDFKNVPVILEMSNLTIEQIVQDVNFVRNTINIS